MQEIEKKNRNRFRHLFTIASVTLLLAVLSVVSFNQAESIQQRYESVPPISQTFRESIDTAETKATSSTEIKVESSASTTEPHKSENEEQSRKEKSIVQTILTESECAELRDSTSFYADPEAQVIRVVKKLQRSNDDTVAIALQNIACAPHPTWLFGDNFEKTFVEVEKKSTAADSLNKIPVFVLYNRAARNSLEWESGILNDEYNEWVRGIAQAIGEHQAWIVLEPDALAIMSQYSQQDQEFRLGQFEQSVLTIKETAPNTRVYIDAGHGAWNTTRDAADTLLSAGVLHADGFSLNISNFRTTETEVEYGNAVSELIGGKHFIIDTARNGNGPTSDAEWCNPRGRALGEFPTTDTGEQYVDGFHWLKPPGESDGTCNGGPQAGIFWIDYAVELVENAIN